MVAIKNPLIILMFALAFTPLQAQNIGGHKSIDDSDVNPWIADKKSDYEFVYHFGDSEWEYNLVIIVADDKVYGLKSWGEFNDDATAWIRLYQPLTNARIVDDMFYCDEMMGQFAIYQGDQKGLKLLDEETQDLHVGYEFGPQSFYIGEFFEGQYPVASYRIVTEKYLNTKTKDELKIMRNEIFARYGYQFIPGGKMDTYFRKQAWYTPQHSKVDQFLTPLEKQNIKAIQAAETR